MRGNPVSGVLCEADLAAASRHFGADEEQVRRDHVISHALGSLSRLGTDTVTFFGGTALSRTHLAGLRLSEDIDLVSIGHRREVAPLVQEALTTSLRRSFATPTFMPDISETKSPAPSVMTVGEISVQIQLLSSEGYPRWPTEVTDIEQRYADAPAAQMRVLTVPSFAAAKLSAWHDRGAARDLYDLWALAERGMVNAEARSLFASLGPVTNSSRVSFDQILTKAEWETALGHQCILMVGPEEAARVARAAWA